MLDGPAAEGWMQSAAAELNLPETAFLVASDDGFSLRWFTPTVESDLCGHATLASAHVLWETGSVAPAETIRFHTRSGLLSARRDHEWIDLDFPAEPAQPVEPPAPLLSALRLRPEEVVRAGRNRFDYLVELASAGRLRDLAPDFPRLRQVECRGAIVTSQPDDDGSDFVSRFFAPRAGIDEDPVTGSAHCCLGPYWGAKLGKSALTGRQMSKRGGVVRVSLRGSRVALLGQAVTVWRGAFAR